MTYPAGSYIINATSRTAVWPKNLLEKQDYPDAAEHVRRQRLVDGLRDGRGRGRSGRQVHSRRAGPPVDKVVLGERSKGTSGSSIAVAHLGSNNMVTFRYLLRNVPMRSRNRVLPPVTPRIRPVRSSSTRSTPRRCAVWWIRSVSSDHAAECAVGDDARCRCAAHRDLRSGRARTLGWYRLTFDEFKSRTI